MTFDGTVSILFTAVQNTTNVTLNAYNITFHSYNLTAVSGGGSPISITWLQDWQSQLQMVVFHLNGTLTQGSQYKLTIVYSGKLQTRAQGIFAFTYFEYGQTLWMIATQFEAKSSRLAFPCFDEPAYKARFNVKVIHPTAMRALSNMMERDPVPLA